jgi:IS30 family transposase
VALSAGQWRVVRALLGGKRARTYPEVAARLGVHVGTVSRQLARVKERHPALYARVMAQRRRQLEVRHRAAVKRDRSHSRTWFENRPKHRTEGLLAWYSPADIAAQRRQVRAMLREALGDQYATYMRRRAVRVR